MNMNECCVRSTYLKPELLWCDSDPTESDGLLNLTVKP